MAATRSLSLALGICLVFHFVSARDEGMRCTERNYGGETGYPMVLGTAYLQDPRAYSYDISIPAVCNTRAVGVRLIVCDYNKEPDLFINSNYEAHTNRRDGLFYPATVTGTVYCSDEIPLGTGLGTPKISVKAVVTIDKSQNTYNQNAKQSSVVTQGTSGYERNQSKIRARYNARHNAQAVQRSDARQVNDSVQEAVAANLDQSRRIDARSSDQSSDASRKNLRLPSYKRLRRASQISNSDMAVESVHDAKADKARKAADQVHQQVTQEARHADQASEVLTKNQVSAVQNRSRRALQSSSTRHSTDALDARQNVDVAREVLESNARQAALDRGRQLAIFGGDRGIQSVFSTDASQATDIAHQTIAANNARTDALVLACKQALEELRAASNSETSNVRQDLEAVREIYALDQARHQAIIGARMSEQIPDASRVNLHHKNNKHLRRGSQTSDLPSNYATSSDARQTAELILKALDANKRQDSLEQTRQQALQEATRAIHAVQVSEARQAAEKARQVTSTNNARQADLNQPQQQAIQEDHRALQASQASNARQAADKVRQAISALTLTRTARLDQTQYQSNDDANRAIQAAQAFNALQTADKVHQALATNNIRQVILDQAQQQAKLEANRAAQVSDTRQTGDLVREAIEANAEAVIDKPRKQNSDIHQATQEVRKVLSANVRQDPANKYLLSEQAYEDSRLYLPIAAYRRNRRALLSSNAGEIADAIRDAKAIKAHQAAHDQAYQKVTQDSRLADEIDAQRKNQRVPGEKKVYSSNTHEVDNLQQDALALDARQSTLNDARIQAIARRSTQTGSALDALRVSEALRDALANSGLVGISHELADTLVGNARQAALNQGRLQALHEERHNAPSASQSTGAHPVADRIQEALASNARQAALDQAYRKAVLEVSLKYDRYPTGNKRF